ncbi:MAG: polysaccharide biosynthesis/export family protein, partial [Runella zeae]
MSHFMSFFHRYTFIFALIVGGVLNLNSTSAQAQQSPQAPTIDSISDEQFMEFYKRAMASGMSEIQMEQAALAQGFTLTDISNARKRLAKIQSEQNKNGKDSVISPRRQIGKLSIKTKNANLRDSLKLPLKTPKKLLIYGSTLFENSNLAFEPNLRLATPTSYVLGPDDELLVDIYGNASDSYKLKVSPEGTV